jgi:hypothetical protein
VSKNIEELTCDVSGFDIDSSEHLRWLERRLQVGDRIAVEVIEVVRADTPRRRHLWDIRPPPPF